MKENHPTSKHAPGSGTISPRVLIVDDNLIEQDICASILHRAGYEVSVTSSANQATKIISKNFQIAIIDLTLPNYSGFDLLNKITQEQPSIIPIVITDNNSVVPRITALNLQAYWYLQKPILEQELLCIIERSLTLLNLMKSTEDLQKALEFVLQQNNRRKVSSPSLLRYCVDTLHQRAATPLEAPLASSIDITKDQFTNENMSLREIEKRAILQSMLLCGGNKVQAARLLGISEKSIYNKISRLGISLNIKAAVKNRKNNSRGE